MTDREKNKQQLTELHDAMDDEANDAVLRGISGSKSPNEGEAEDDKPTQK